MRALRKACLSRAASIRDWRGRPGCAPRRCVWAARPGTLRGASRSPAGAISFFVQWNPSSVTASGTRPKPMFFYSVEYTMDCDKLQTLPPERSASRQGAEQFLGAAGIADDAVEADVLPLKMDGKKSAAAVPGRRCRGRFGQAAADTVPQKALKPAASSG